MSSTGKQAGKTEWAGRRRPMTRRAGFNAAAPVQLQVAESDWIELRRGEVCEIEFVVPPTLNEQWSGFGGWMRLDGGFDVVLTSPVKSVLTEYRSPSWNKFGSLVLADGRDPGYVATLRITATTGGLISLFGLNAGVIEHTYLTSSRAALRSNMWAFAPEANFYDSENLGEVNIMTTRSRQGQGELIDLKSCNRCGRFLPVNLSNERDHLSFSSHCVAPHRRPCRHAGFGRIQLADGRGTVQLEYGFQLECRFCKKFEVNAAHNPQRTSGQMKEDAARRRHFELLLEHLYQGTPQLRYKNETGRDLAADTYAKFGGRCFKCGARLASEREMHLDHTRPLALLWPLDSTATALCETHNTGKRDRPPSEFYTPDELLALSQITGIPLADLEDPSPNVEAIDLLGENLDWFFDEFLQLPELQKVRDGKLTADLVVKALEKVLARYPGGSPFRLG